MTDTKCRAPQQEVRVLGPLRSSVEEARKDGCDLETSEDGAFGWFGVGLVKRLVGGFGSVGREAVFLDGF